MIIIICVIILDGIPLNWDNNLYVVMVIKLLSVHSKYQYQVNLCDVPSFDSPLQPYSIDLEPSAIALTEEIPSGLKVTKSFQVIHA